MSRLLQESLIWRLCAAFAALLARSPLGRAGRYLGALWRGSATYGFFARLLRAEPLAGRSAFRRLLDRLSAALSRAGAGLRRAAEESASRRLCGAVRRYGSGSFFLGWLFAGGVNTLLLCIVAAFTPIDHLLRDGLKLETLGAVWDELLLLVCLLWILREFLFAERPLRSRTNAPGIFFGAYLLVGLLLLLYNITYLDINITGYRASMQGILLFFLVLRMLDRRGLRVMYNVMLAFAFAFALHGIWQFIVGVEIPSNWTDQAETSVRTRVFSIFSNPNIMGGYMVLFAPMAIGKAYASRSPAQKVFFWICGLSMCLGCLFTMSRGAWLALAAAAALFALIIDRRLLAVMLVGGVAACFLPFVRSRIGYLFTSAFVESNNRAGRAKRWATALGYLDEYHAWAGGLGYGIYGGAVAAQNPINPALDYMYVDNYYVKILTENGVIGLSALLSALGALLWGGARSCAKAEPGDKPLCAGMLAGLVGILIHSLFECLWEEPYMMALFFTVAAMLIYLGFFARREEAKG